MSVARIEKWYQARPFMPRHHPTASFKSLGNVGLRQAEFPFDVYNFIAKRRKSTGTWHVGSEFADYSIYFPDRGPPSDYGRSFFVGIDWDGGDAETGYHRDWRACLDFMVPNAPIEKMIIDRMFMLLPTPYFYGGPEDVYTRPSVSQIQDNDHLVIALAGATFARSGHIFDWKHNAAWETEDGRISGANILSPDGAEDSTWSWVGRDGAKESGAPVTDILAVASMDDIAYPVADDIPEHVYIPFDMTRAANLGVLEPGGRYSPIMYQHQGCHQASYPADATPNWKFLSQIANQEWIEPDDELKIWPFDDYMYVSVDSDNNFDIPIRREETVLNDIGYYGDISHLYHSGYFGNQLVRPLLMIRWAFPVEDPLVFTSFKYGRRKFTFELPKIEDDLMVMNFMTRNQWGDGTWGTRSIVKIRDKTIKEVDIKSLRQFINPVANITARMKFSTEPKIYDDDDEVYGAQEITTQPIFIPHYSTPHNRELFNVTENAVCQGAYSIMTEDDLFIPFFCAHKHLVIGGITGVTGSAEAWKMTISNVHLKELIDVGDTVVTFDDPIDSVAVGQVTAIDDEDKITIDSIKEPAVADYVAVVLEHADWIEVANKAGVSYKVEGREVTTELSDTANLSSTGLKLEDVGGFNVGDWVLCMAHGEPVVFKIASISGFTLVAVLGKIVPSANVKIFPGAMCYVVYPFVAQHSSEYSEMKVYDVSEDSDDEDDYVARTTSDSISVDNGAGGDVKPVCVVTASKRKVEDDDTVTFFFHNSYHKMKDISLSKFHANIVGGSNNNETVPMVEVTFPAVGAKTVNCYVEDGEGQVSDTIQLTVNVYDEYVLGKSIIINVTQFTDGSPKYSWQGGLIQNIRETMGNVLSGYVETHTKKILSFNFPATATRYSTTAGAASHPIAEVSAYATGLGILGDFPDDFLTMKYLEATPAACLKMTIEGESYYLLLEDFNRDRNARENKNYKYTTSWLMVKG